MIPVSVDDTGPVSLARMLRDGVVEYLAPGYGMPRDLPLSPEARARTLSPVVPAHTVVSGLVGLWVRHGGQAPLDVDLVGARGLHRAKPGADARGWTLSFHSGRAATEPCDRFSTVAVANSERCAADALRWRDLGAAMEAVYRAVRSGRVDCAATEAIVRGDDPRGSGAARVRSAWRALVVATSEASPRRT